VHPGNLFAAYEQMSAAEAELQAIEEELYEQLKMKFAKKMINEKLPKRDQDSVKPEDLEIAIKRLQQRHESIETLEKLLLGQGNLENLEKLVLGQSNVMDAQSQFSKTVKQFFAGGFAGCVSRTVVAPIDRVKILMQTEKITSGGAEAKHTSIVQSLRTIVNEGGVTRLWRSNTANIVRVAPYSASQFASYDLYKLWIMEFRSQEWGVAERLLTGALAALTATTVTHPLDVIRVRIATQPELRGIGHAASSMVAEGGARVFYKGYVPTVLSLTPFISINFATFDYMKSSYMEWRKAEKIGSVPTLAMGAASGLIAQTMCYPLDTVRRRMQLKGTVYTSTSNALQTIVREEGFRALYLGMAPNALKIVPNNAIRFGVYSKLKDWLGLN